MGPVLLEFVVLEFAVLETLTLTGVPLLDLLFISLVARITSPTVRSTAPVPMMGSLTDSRRVGATCVTSVVEGIFNEFNKTFDHGKICSCKGLNFRILLWQREHEF